MYLTTTWTIKPPSSHNPERGGVGFIHEEHFAEHHKVLNRGAKDTVDVINKREQWKKVWSQSESVCCYVGVRMHYDGAVSLPLRPFDCKSFRMRFFFSLLASSLFSQTNVHKQHKTNHRRGWKEMEAAVLVLMLPGNQTKVI